MANYEATKYDFSGGNLTGIEGVNTGLVVPWTDSTIPSGFLECNGQAVSRTTYSALFAIIGTNYGTGDGSTTFNVPDLAGRCCQNTSPNKALATQGGANTVTTTGNISGNAGNTTISTPTMASHNHPFRSGGNQYTAGSGGSADQGFTTSGNAGGGGAHSHPVSATFTGNAKSVLQPYITLVYIIKT